MAAWDQVRSREAAEALRQQGALEPVLLVPAELVTVTSTLPDTVLAGEVTVIEVGDTTVALVPATPPKLTVEPVRKPVPVMVTTVPPTVEPVAGEIAVMAGVTVV